MKFFIFSTAFNFYIPIELAQPLDSKAHDSEINVNLDTLAYSFAEAQAPDSIPV